MIQSLHVRNYALIETLDVEFGQGLTIITGETGAGKSIIIGALQLLLGARAATDMIRTGATKAVVEGVFSGGGEAVADLLRSADLDVNDQLIVRREVGASSSRAFVNDTPVNLSLLREIAGNLVDLHGQHEHQSLLRPELHVRFLDGFGHLERERLEYQTIYGVLRQLEDDLASLRAGAEEIQRRHELDTFQLAEIDGVDPQPDEEEALEAERRILDNAERLLSTAGAAEDALYGEDGVYDRLASALRLVDELARIDPEVEPLTNELRSAQVAVAEAATSLQDYRNRVEMDPERLETVRERLGAFEHLKRKYGGSMEAVIAHRDVLRKRSRREADVASSAAQLESQITERRVSLTRAARALTEARNRAARDLEPRVVEYLARLGMERSRFEVRMESEPAPDGWVHLDDGPVQAYPDGVDRVEFYLSTNVGEAVRALARVASGGEVSRIMLALKSLMARREATPALVFDEVDVGISGKIAVRVGEALYDLSRSHQLICITHLPQIAARADHHLVVEKGQTEGRTTTTIRSLTSVERAAEVAGLLGGAEVSEAALESARELMRQAN